MRFKHSDITYEYEKMPELLTEMADMFESISESFGIEPVVTRIMAPVEGSSGVHEAGRAIDFRDEYKEEHLYSMEQREILLDNINQEFARTDNKKSLIWHSFDGAPFHFHLQQASVMSVYINREETKDEKEILKDRVCRNVVTTIGAWLRGITHLR